MKKLSDSRKKQKEHKKWMTQEILGRMKSRREGKGDVVKEKSLDKEIEKM